MKTLPATVLIAVAGFVAATAAADAGQPNSDCGGFPLRYGTTIGWTGQPGTRQRVSSVIALAALTTNDDFHARGWVVWDEIGEAWLGLAPKSPPDLKSLWPFSNTPVYAGPGVQVRFAPLKKPLPKGYRLTDCPHTLPYE